MFFFTDYNYERFKPCRSGLFRQLFWDYTYKFFQVLIHLCFSLIIN